MPVDKMLEEIPFSKTGERPRDLPYSFYELFYHCRFAQRDILEYFTSKDYNAPRWPTDYWPAEKAPKDEEDWESLKRSFFEDRKDLIDFILNPELKLEETVPSNNRHTFLRGILLVIEHTSYHTGQMLVVLRLLGLHPS